MFYKIRYNIKLTIQFYSNLDLRLNLLAETKYDTIKTINDRLS